MHNDVAELMRQTETLPICRHIAVQEYARWHIRDLNSKPVDFEGSKVAMHDNAARSLHPLDKISDRPRGDKPSTPDEVGNPLWIATKFIYIHPWQ